MGRNEAGIAAVKKVHIQCAPETRRGMSQTQSTASSTSTDTMAWGHKEMSRVDSYVQRHLFETAEKSAAVLTKEFNGKFTYDEILRQVVHWREYYLSP